jgi:hypothetical protein
MSASALARAWPALVAFFPAALALAKARSPIRQPTSVTIWPVVIALAAGSVLTAVPLPFVQPISCVCIQVKAGIRRGLVDKARLGYTRDTGGVRGRAFASQVAFHLSGDFLPIGPGTWQLGKANRQPRMGLPGH